MWRRALKGNAASRYLRELMNRNGEPAKK